MALIGILLAAGLGTRLRPLTLTTPKPLLRVNNQTLLEHSLDHLSPYVDSFIIVVGYLHEQIETAIGTNYRGKSIQYAVQENPKGGTLDALRTALKNSSGNDSFWVMNSDDIHGQDIFTHFYTLISFNNSQALIGAKVIQDTQRLKNFGVIITDSHTKFIKIVEKPQEYVSNLVNIGIYYFPSTIQKVISQKKDNPFEKEEYITDLLNDYSKKDSIKVVPTTDLWIPTTSPEDISKAETIIKKS